MASKSSIHLNLWRAAGLDGVWRYSGIVYCSFIEPFTAVAALGILVGTAFLLEGLLAIAKGLLAARFIRR
ncbi:MAG: hypothetical protein ACLSAP_11500 [Oscillospiraceae bacterium]